MAQSIKSGIIKFHVTLFFLLKMKDIFQWNVSFFQTTSYDQKTFSNSQTWYGFQDT